MDEIVVQAMYVLWTHLHWGGRVLAGWLAGWLRECLGVRGRLGGVATHLHCTVDRWFDSVEQIARTKA